MPFRDSVANCLELMHEFCILVVAMLHFGLLLFQDEGHKSTVFIGWNIIGILVINASISFITMLIVQGIGCYKIIKFWYDVRENKKTIAKMRYS